MEEKKIIAGREKITVQMKESQNLHSDQLLGCFCLPNKQQTHM